MSSNQNVARFQLVENREVHDNQNTIVILIPAKLLHYYDNNCVSMRFEHYIH